MDSESKTESHVTLRPVGDVELWYAQHPEGDWSLPLWVEWKVNQDTGQLFGLVIPGLCFYHVQLLTLQALLQRNSLQEDINRWLLLRNSVHSLLRKAPGIHPEFYYHWPGSDYPPIPTVHHAFTMRSPGVPDPQKIETYRSFAEFISRERHIPSDVVLVVLSAIAQCSAKWLVEFRRPIHLGFVKLLAVPYRVNWKEIMLFKCRPWRLMSILKMPKGERDAALATMSFEGTACSIHNIGFSTRPGEKECGLHKRMDYTIEAVPQRSFELSVDEIEHERMQSGKTSYVAHYEETVEILYNHIVEALSSYAKKVSKAWGKVREDCITGLLEFVPVERWSVAVRGVRLCNLPAHICPTDKGFSVIAENRMESDPHLIQAQVNEMPKLSIVPSCTDVVRERKVKRDLDRLEDEEGRTDGMLVRYDGEVTDTREPVLPCEPPTNGKPSGVD